MPDAVLAADGDNLLAIRDSDYGVSTYLDLRVSYDDGPAYAVYPLHEASLVPDAATANPGQDFRYAADLGGYIYNLKTTGFGSGTWVVTFTVDGVADPSYYVTFDVR